MIPMLMSAAASTRRLVTPATVDIFPNGANATRANGATWSGTANATVSGGVGPFTYQWSWASGGVGFSLSGATTSSCTASAGPFTNATRQGSLQVVVTDTGNGNQTCSDSIPVIVKWGTG